MQYRYTLLALVFSISIITAGEPAAEPVQESESKITHAFLATGGDTFIMSAENKITWRYPKSTRDGWVLPNGNILLAVSKGKDYPSGAIVEVDKEGKTVFEFKGTQSEVDTVQALDNGNYMLTESGDKPRLMEVDKSGKIVLEFPLQCQNKNHHMETRMARKLANGNYLVPHLLDKVVREYTKEGKVVWEARTPDSPPECWPFTAIRLDNGNTLVNLTHGNMTVEFDAAGKIVWQVTNADLPSPLFKDPCGAQRLPNGNTVITSYAERGTNALKMFEITPDKKVVWTFKTGKGNNIHEFHIFETNGKPLEGRPLR